MRTFAHPDHHLHAPGFFLLRGRVAANFEVPARATALEAALRRLGLPPEMPLPIERATLGTVHDHGYLDFLADAHAAWSALPDAGPEAVANVFPTADMLANAGRPPNHIVGRLGWYTADTACPIGPGTWQAALGAASAAIAAARVAATGAQAYALCRPPGHHAYRARAGGHCYLNNAALAAEHLRRSGAARVAVLDIDSHHGNGTQGIFWDRPDVLTVSVHADPSRYYPWFTGHADEVGCGTNRNLPVAFGADDGVWLDAVAEGVATLERFGADALVVSLGFDASEDEPLRALSVTENGFARAGGRIGALRLPSAIVQEGGYAVDRLGVLLERFLGGWGDR